MDVIEGINVSCVDVSVPLIIIPARELGIKGDESPDVLNKNKSLLNQIELIRRKIGILANLGDVSSKVIPKISIISKPKKILVLLHQDISFHISAIVHMQLQVHWPYLQQ